MKLVKRVAPSFEDDDLMKGWKDIAKHLQCSVKQAHRLEMNEDLPVFRPANGSKGPVFASKRAINAWIKSGIQSAVIADNRLIVFDRRAKILWAHEFSLPIHIYPKDELDWRLRFVDLHGDGDRGILLTIRLAGSGFHDQIFYFTSEGKLEWTLEPKPELQKAGGAAFEDAWEVKHLITVPEKAGHQIYIAMANAAGWGGCILRVDAMGTSSVQFANIGFVERLCLAGFQDERLIIACGENNDYDCAFVALLGVDDQPSCSIPGKRTVYRFANAPQETPRKYILFPRTGFIAAGNRPYGHAQYIRQYQDRVIVEVETGGEGCYFLYHLTELLEPMYVFPSGRHEFLHQSFERAGVINHPWSQCPELDKPLMLRIWTRIEGWQSQEIPWRDNPWKETDSTR